MAFFVFSVTAIAQKYDIKIYSVNEGLPQQQVSGLSQDSHGYMWFGTYGEGLARFDGKEFYQITEQNGLRDNQVYELFHDSEGRFWTGTESGGLARVVGDTAVYQFQDSPLDTLVVNDMVERSDSTLWVGSYGGGLFHFNEDTLSRITTNDGLASNIVWDVMERGSHQYWVATHYGVSVVTGHSSPLVKTLEGTEGLAVYRIFEDGGGRIWLGTSDGLRLYEEGRPSEMRTINGVELGYVYDIASDPAGNVWVATAENGMFRWDGEQFVHLTDENGLSSNYMYELFRDRDGYLWASTDENGVNLIRSNAFLRYDNDSSPLMNAVLSVYTASDSTLWVGTDHGLLRREGDMFVPVFGENEAAGEEVWTITEGPGGTLYFLLGDNSILEFDGRQFRDLTALQGWALTHTIDILADSRGRLWIGRQDALLLYQNGETQRFTTEDGLPSQTIWDFFESPDGHIWLATDNGLARFDDGEFTVFDTEDGLAHNRVSHITEAPDGHLWLGTAEGISRMILSPDSSAPRFLNIGDLHDTHRDETQLLAFDSDTMLWQGTNAGLHRINVLQYLETGELSVQHFGFDIADQGIETMHRAVSGDSEGRLWIGTVDGLIMYDPAKTYDTPVRPSVHITSLAPGLGTFDTSAARRKEPSVEGPFTFRYDEDNPAFSFAATDYHYPDEVRYSYRLRGYSEEWSPLTDSRRAIFTNLPPGDYRFEVRARNSHASWSVQEAGLHFNIRPPFWQRSWFQILVGLAVLGGLLMFTRVRLHYLERHKLRELVDRKTEDLQQALAEKEVLIKEVHHRVKNNLAVVTGLLQMQEFESEDEGTRTVLQDSQMRIKSISLVHEKLYQSDNLALVRFNEYMEDLLDAIRMTFHNVDDRIAMKTHIDEFRLPVNLAIPSSLILNELVTNAYKHAFRDDEEGTITIFASCNEETVMVEVRDSGPGLPDGFDPDQQSSLGMTLIQTLTVQLSGSLEMFNDNGAVFRITYPLDQPE